jgi:predicted small secreted protein/putative NIF3 family GTP cyclohydrolase 1 type 2
MATRNNTFILKRSNVVNKIPILSGLTLGELALNTADAKLYSLYTGGLSGATEVRQIGWDRLSISGGTLYGNLDVLGSISATTYYGDGSNLTGLVTNDFYVTGGTYSNGFLTLERQNGSVVVSGFTTEVITVGENVVYGDLLYLSNDGKYYKTSNSSESTSSTELRISLDTINLNDTGVALIKGKFTTTGLIAGEIYIIGPSGTITNTEPIADGSIIRIVGTALDSTTLEFNPDQTYLEISSGIPVEPPNCIPNLYVSNLHSCSPLHINPNAEGDVYIGESGGVNVGIGTFTPTALLDVNGQIKSLTLDTSVINVDTLNVTTNISGIYISSVSGLQAALDNKSDLSSLVYHTGDTNNPHQTTFYNLVNTAHTHTISDIFDLNNQLNNKLNSSGGIITGSLTVNGNFVTLGSATTINTETLSIKDNLIVLNSNLTGNTEPFFGDSGVQVIRGSGTTANLFWSESGGYWVAGLSGSTKKIVLENQPITSNVNIIGSLSATTLYGNGQFLTGLVTTDFFVTGGTFLGTTLTLNRQNGSVTITGFTSGGGSGTFTGGTISGSLTLSSLTGTTDRMLEVDSLGVVSADRTIITAYLVSGSTQANLLENASNWGDKIYTGTTITDTYQGQKHYDSNYFFEAVDNNLWIRLSRV